MTRRLAVLAAATAFLGTAAPAAADVICVPQPLPGCDTDRPDITQAVDVASLDDEIRIAPGAYTGPATQVTKRLNFVGAGAGTLEGFDPTIHTRIIAATGQPGLDLSGGGSVRSLQVLGAPGGNGGQNGVSLTGDEVSYVLTDVVAMGGEGSTAPGDGLGLFATQPVDVLVTGGAFRGGVNSGVPAAVGASAFGLGVVPSLTLVRTTLDGASGLTVSSADVALQESLVGPTTVGVSAISGATVRVERSRISAEAVALRIEPANPGASLELVDSLVEVTNEELVDAAAARVSTNGPFPATLTTRGSTIIARGNGPLTGVGVVKSQTPTGAISADLRNTLVRVESSDPTSRDLVVDRGTIAADFSSFSSSLALNGGSVPAPGSASNISGDPLLAPDLALTAGSPLIDRGDPALVTAGELDLAGTPRSADGNGDGTAAPDIGAFEFPAAAVNLAPSLSSLSVSNRVFAPVRARAAQKRKRRVKRGTTFRYVLSEPARVAIRIERRLKGRRVKGKCRKPSRKNRGKRACKRFKRSGVLRADERAGAQRTAFGGRFGKRALKPGRYRARLVATDAEGARSAERRLSLRVVRP